MQGMEPKTRKPQTKSSTKSQLGKISKDVIPLRLFEVESLILVEKKTCQQYGEHHGKNCGDMFGKPTKDKSCQYNTYDPR